MTWLVVTPAYGRDYRSAKSALADWYSGKDFRIASIVHGAGQLTSIRDWPDATVEVRYNRLERLAIAKPKTTSTS